MIEYRQGDIWESGADIIVIPTNCEGVMGAGLAKQAAERFPGLSTKQRRAVGELRVGLTTLYSEYQPMIVCLPTKVSWRNPSRLEYVDAGLLVLALNLVLLGQSYTVAVPALGCGLGQLLWSEVRPLIEKHLSPLDGYTFLVYEPRRA